MINKLSFRRQKGFSLIELSLAFVVLGVTAILLWQLLGHRAQVTQQVNSRSLLERAKDATYAFARLNGRLPCVATASKGEEDCTQTNNTGLFPFLTVGLPESAPIRYQISSVVPSLTSEMRFEVVLADDVLSEKIGPTPKSMLLSEVVDAYSAPRLLDLCASLAGSMPSLKDAFELEDESSIRESFQRASSRIFISRTELAGALDCTAIVAPARAYFNTLLASSIIRRGAKDGVDQFNRDYWTNGWNLAQGTYSSSAALFSLMKSSWLFSNAQARYDLSAKQDLTQPVYQAYAVASMLGAGISLGTSTSNLGRFAMLQGVSTIYKDDIEKNFEDLTQLDSEIRERAIQSASRTYFLEPSL